MPHQCVRCNAFYEDGSNEILKGCPCGGRLFFYVKKEFLEKQKEITKDLTKEEKKKIEKEVYEIIDAKGEEEPVILDLESIRIREHGKYDIDLVKLFNKKPLIIKLEEGKYIIDLPESFRRMK